MSLTNQDKKLEQFDFSRLDKLASKLKSLREKVMKELFPKCPVCKDDKKTICGCQCWCDLLKNKHITQEYYDNHIKVINNDKEKD